MKRVLAFLLCLVMVFCLSAAFAESPMVAVEDLYEGVWVQFEEGFEFYLPADWYEYELSEDLAAEGFAYLAGNEDLSRSLLLAWQPMDQDCTIEELQAIVAASYPDATIMEANGVGLVGCTNGDQLVLVALDGAEPGMYYFFFTPIDDEEFVTLAALIASTIRNF